MDKTESGTCIIFLGIELDTIKMEARLPEDKLQKCRTLVNKYLQHKKIRVHQLESLTGHLSFACSVISPGRPFLRRLYSLLKGVRQSPHHLIDITKGAKEDLRMWAHFFSKHNGITLFQEEEWTDATTMHFYTDAAGTLGYGIVFGSKFAYGVWPDTWKEFNIAFLELYPIMVALKLFGQAVQNKRVHLHVDNQAVVAIINSQTSKDPQIMVLVRDLVLTLMQNNTTVKATYISTKNNYLADFLSRQQVDEFRKHAPWADETPTEVPPKLRPENYDPTYNLF